MCGRMFFIKTSIPSIILPVSPSLFSRSYPHYTHTAILEVTHISQRLLILFLLIFFLFVLETDVGR